MPSPAGGRGRPGTLVERAVAKRDAAPARPAGPAHSPQEQPGTPPSGRRGDAAATATAASGGEAGGRRVVEIDRARLAQAGVYIPDTGANRTTEEIRLIKREVLQRAAKAREDGAANADLAMVTSTREGEGKTFVSLNLAFSVAAETDHPVILVDADPAKSSVTRQLGLAAERGLMELLEEDDPRPDGALLATTVDRLSILPAGRHHPLSAELFASDRMAALLRAFHRARPGSLVILDAPPVLATTEPRALAGQVGQTILVVEAERTSRAAVGEALSLIGICPRIGLVLNKARFRFGAVRFGSYYKAYYYPRKRRAAAGG